jgi:hypothetical protein
MNKDEPRLQSRSRCAAALVEVLLAFALVHVGWRLFKHLTWLGRLEGAAHLNYSPGPIMIAFTILAWISTEKN